MEGYKNNPLKVFKGINLFLLDILERTEVEYSDLSSVQPIFLSQKLPAPAVDSWLEYDQQQLLSV